MVVALMLGICAVSAQAQEYHYRYVSLDSVELPLPPGYTYFSPGSIQDNGRVYGVVLDESFLAYIAVYKDGAVTVIHPEVALGAGGLVNAGGTVSGDVLVDHPYVPAQESLAPV